MVISRSKGNSKATEARAAKPSYGPITRYRSMNGWPGLLLAGTHLVPSDLSIYLGASGESCREASTSPHPNSGKHGQPCPTDEVGYMQGNMGTGWRKKAQEMTNLGGRKLALNAKLAKYGGWGWRSTKVIQIGLKNDG